MVKKFLQKGRMLPVEMKALLVAVLTLIIVTTGVVFFFKTHEDIAANFADYVLRPAIGSQATVTLESYLFALQDVFNKVQYHFMKPDTRVFSDVKLASASAKSAFTLTPIPVADRTAGEGVWTTIAEDGANPLMAQTFLRPDPQRDYAIVALVKLNMQKLSIDAAAGTWEPGEAAERGPGKVPQTVQKSNLLIAAFNGGFQKKDGAYGMIVGQKTYLPLQKNLATLVMYSDKNPQLFRYEGRVLGSDVVAVRQNGPMLIENGKIVTQDATWNMQTWGLTTTNSMYTWRSGLGITATGDLIYAVGPSLVPETLALALQKAGAVNAMQLDINPVWVRFVLYHSLGSGKYSYQMLLKDMTDGGLAYLSGYQKDFFYVYEKPDMAAKQEKEPMQLTIFSNASHKVYAGLFSPQTASKLP